MLYLPGTACGVCDIDEVWMASPFCWLVVMLHMDGLLWRPLQPAKVWTWTYLSGSNMTSPNLTRLRQLHRAKIRGVLWNKGNLSFWSTLQIYGEPFCNLLIKYKRNSTHSTELSMIVIVFYINHLVELDQQAQRDADFHGNFPTGTPPRILTL